MSEASQEWLEFSLAEVEAQLREIEERDEVAFRVFMARLLGPFDDQQERVS